MIPGRGPGDSREGAGDSGEGSRWCPGEGSRWSRRRPDPGPGNAEASFPQRLQGFYPWGSFQAAQEREQHPRRDTGWDTGVGYWSIALRGAAEFANGVFNIRCQSQERTSSHGSMFGFY